MKPIEKDKLFPQIGQPYLVEFSRSHYIVEIAAGLDVEELLDPTRWGPQPRMKRLDLVEVIATDNRFHALLAVTSTASGHPAMRIVWIVREEKMIEDSAASNRTEYRIDREWVAIIDNEIVASGFADQAAAEVELGARLNGGAA